MPKGMFTQTVCVLLKQPISCAQLEPALSAFAIRGRQEDSESWAYGGPALTLDFRPEVNGYVVVDTVDQPWPDHMGDAQNEAMLFGAWSMGFFGPFAFPGGLQRAAQQCWGWEAGKKVANRHKGFVRIRSSYVLGGDENAPVMPEAYDAVAELRFVTDVASALLQLPQALCYFNPNGEVLRDRDGLRQSLEFAQSAKLLPLDIWSNVRLFNLEGDWSLMDTVGNGQLDLPDIEAGFAPGYDYGEIDRFLRNISWYLLQKGEVIKAGDTMDGPGNVPWQARCPENALTDPPRRVMRWLPLDDADVPAPLLTE